MRINFLNTKYLPDEERNNFRIEFTFSGVEDWIVLYRVDDNQPVADCTVHTMNLFPSSTFSFSFASRSVHISLLLFSLQYNIWITIGNIGVCVAKSGVCRSEGKCRCAWCMGKVVCDARKMQCALLHFTPLSPCEGIVCWTNKYLWANCNGRFMLNNKSSGFKGNGYRKQNVFTYVGDDVGDDSDAKHQHYV